MNSKPALACILFTKAPMELNSEIVTTPPRPASTVMMLRDVDGSGDVGLEVFLLKRHGLSDVLGGAYVFPGGKVDRFDAELDMAAQYHLTVVVGADEDIRVARVVGTRGAVEPDVRARIAAQASEVARKAAADVWLDNNGTRDELIAQVDALWQDRIVGFNDNLMTGSRSHRPDAPTPVAYDDSWPSAANRLIGRITLALSDAGLGDRAVSIDHIGSTSVPGLVAKDVIDLQIAVRRLSDADEPEFVKALADKGFPRVGGNNQDTVHPLVPHPSAWAKRFHGSADPGRVAHVHVRELGSAGWDFALLFRDWLVANPTERDDYADLKRALARTETTTTAYTLAKEPWIADALERARVWARHTGWRVP